MQLIWIRDAISQVAKYLNFVNRVQSIQYIGKRGGGGVEGGGLFLSLTPINFNFSMTKYFVYMENNLYI
jgi:hypothetical protein